MDVEDRVDGLWKSDDQMYNIVTEEDCTIKIIAASTGEPIPDTNITLSLIAVMVMGDIDYIQLTKTGRKVIISSASNSGRIGSLIFYTEGDMYDRCGRQTRWAVEN